MATINLLPWREQIREVRKQQFIQVWIAATVLSLVVMGGVHGFYYQKNKSQHLVNVSLKKEIAELDLKINSVKQIKQERADLISRMQVIQQLQTSRPTTVKVFDNIVRIMPKGVFLTEFSRQNNQIVFKGKAESNTRVSELMRALEQSPYFGFPQLTEIKTDKSEQVYKSRFELHCTLQDLSGAKHG